MANALSSITILVVVVVVTARVSLPAGRMLVATTLAAIVAILFAASIPDRVRQHLDELDWRHGVVALDHQFARREHTFHWRDIESRPGDTSRGAASPGMDCATSSSDGSSLEMHAGHVEGAIARIADREGAIRAAACVHAAKARRACDCKLTGRRIPGHANMMGTAGSLLVTVIVAVLAPWLVGAKRIGAGSESPAPTPSGSAITSGTTKSAVDELIPVTRSRAFPRVVEDQVFIDKRTHAALTEIAAIGDYQGQPRRRTLAGHIDDMGAGRIVAENLDFASLETKTSRLEADHDIDRIAGLDLQWIGEDARWPRNRRKSK